MRVEEVINTFTGHPVSYDTTDYSYRTYQNAANAYTDSSSTTYAQAYIVNGANAESWLYYKFDTSSIPDGATILSVSCTARCAASGGSAATPTKWMCFFCGTTQKGNTYALSTTTNVRTLTLASGLTLADLRDARVKVYVKRGTSSNLTTSYYIRFYGATLTVQYSYEETYYTVTASTNSSQITVSPSSQEYLAGDDATISISGDISEATVTDNGTDVTSAVSGSGTSHSYLISNISADHAVIVSTSGQAIFLKQNGTWVPVSQVYRKENGVWVSVNTLYLKENGTWKS